MITLLRMLLGLMVVASVWATASDAAPNATWQDPRYGYKITYPTSVNLTTKGSTLQREFMKPPRFMASFTPEGSHDVSDEFLIAEVRNVGNKSTRQHAADLLKDERKQGAALLADLRPATISGRGFYTFTTNTGGTVVRHHVIVHDGNGFDFKVEDKTPGGADRINVLTRIVQSVRF